MDILIVFLTVLEVLVCILLILIVLMQRPRQEGLGAAFGGGMMDSLAGAHTTNVLQKGTTYLGGTLFVITALLAIILSHRTAGETGQESLVKDSDKPIPAETAPSATTPEAPATTSETPPTPEATNPGESTPAAPAPAAPAPKSEASPAPAPTAPGNVIPVPTTPPPPPPVPAPAPGSAK
jgi:preprotein translocase subunit SecG